MKKEDLPPDQYAARVLAAEMAANQRAIDEAMKKGDNDLIAEAATKQAIDFKENLPFIIYALKKFGGLNPPMPVPKSQLPTLADELIGEAPSRVMGASGLAVVAATQ